MLAIIAGVPSRERRALVVLIELLARSRSRAVVRMIEAHRRAKDRGELRMVAHRFVGQPIARIEDAALLRGAGRFVDDVLVLGALEAAFVRSPFAHARIKSIDVAAACAAPAVSAVLAYADIRPLLDDEGGEADGEVLRQV